MIHEPDENFPEALRDRLSQQLPGIRRCKAFAPELCYGRHAGPPAHDARSAAVLALFYRAGGQWRIPLILRPDFMPSHAGQVSFPGGMIEPGETIEQAAVREYREELGDAAAEVQLLGRLSPIYVFASNFLVTPCVAWSPTPPVFAPNPAEVANLLEARVVELGDAARRGSHSIDRRGVRLQAPHMACENQLVWGATSLMLAELMIVIAEASS